MIREEVKPVDLKFCVNAQYLTSAIELGFINNSELFEALPNARLCTYLDEQVEELEIAITVKNLDALVENELHMNMENRNTRSRIQGLFVDYHSPLMNK